jgi:exosome complex component CSL4
MKESTEIVTPGTPLGYKTEFQVGEGTYIRDEFVYASLIGEKRIVKGEDGEVNDIKTYNNHHY